MQAEKFGNLTDEERRNAVDDVKDKIMILAADLKKPSNKGIN